MYKHDIHRGFTYVFFFLLTLIILIPTVPVSFKMNEYTYMNALIFSILGITCFGEIYLGLHETIKDKSFLAAFVRYLFILPIFAINCTIVLFCNWLVVQQGLVESTNFTWYTVLGGFTWLLSFHLAKIMPNLPAIVMKKREQ